MKDLENKQEISVSQETVVEYLQVTRKKIIGQKQLWIYGALCLGLIFMKYQEKGFWYTFCASLTLGGFLYFLYFFAEAWDLIKTKNITKGKLIVHSIIFCLVLLLSILFLSWRNIAQMLGLSLIISFLFSLFQPLIQKFKGK